MGFLDMIKNTFNSSKNFRYLDNLIHSGVKEIILDSDISLEDNEKTEYLDGIELDVDDLIIDGNGHRIDARIKTRIFHCSGNNVTIKNITLTNGLTHENGGAIYNESKELYIFNSALIENIANKYGGAICNDGTIRIQNLSFKKNLAGSSNDIQNNNQLIIKGTLSSDRTKSITNNNHCFIESRKFMENIESFGKIFDIESLENNQRDFTYLNKLIRSGSSEIKLETDIRLNIENNEDHLYKYGININQDNLIIDGNGHTIDAQKLGRIFDSTGKNITLKNIKFINGFLDGSGGALGNSGELTIIGCTFYANTVKSLTPRTISPATGGAISNSGKIMIIDSTFNKNTADIGGAAVNNRDGVLNISKSKFFDNTAKEYAGAINNGINAELNITQSQIFKNRASLEGGAIKNGFGNITISESKMYENNAHKAGAIFNNFGVLAVTESRLFNNSADHGGAIVNYRSELTIAESGICGNTALNSGAIINDRGTFKMISCEIMQNESPDNIILNKDFLQINDSSFKANQSDQIILNEGGESDLIIFYGKFIKNQSKESVIDNNGKSLTVEKTLFDNNNSYNIINKNELTLIGPKIKEESKTILNNGYIFMKNTPKEFKNKIEGEGTVEIRDFIEYKKFDFNYLNKIIHENNSSEITLESDIYFEKYEKDFYEGGIELDFDNLVIDGKGHVIDAGGNSRIFLITGKNIILKNITFKNGQAHRDYNNLPNTHGGAIKVNHGVNLTIEKCKFINNISEGSGSAVYAEGNNLNILESTFCENEAKIESTKQGGTIHNIKGKLTIDKTIFAKNTAHGCGGAIFSNGDLLVDDCEFKENTAIYYGGAIFNEESNLTIIKSLFSKNSSEFNGGSILHTYGKLNLFESEFKENTAIYYGGAIYAGIGTEEVNITESILNENRANDAGGAIFLSNHCEINIMKSTLNENISKKGGAIYDDGGSLNIIDSSLLANRANNDGGAIWLENLDEFEHNNCIFKENMPNDVYKKSD